jgi:hypothetical protein
MKFYTLLILLSLGAACSCSKNSINPSNTLPPATDTGENTLGFVIDGQVWVPQGNNGTSRLDLSYDPQLYGGTMLLNGYSITSDTDREYFYLNGIEINQVGTHQIGGEDSNIVAGFTAANYCEYISDDNYSEGSLTITRFDLEERIISGKFQFRMATPSCDTINVTDGRFDMRI